MYQKKKKHIYSSRRRKYAQNYITKLDKIIEQSSLKDIKLIDRRLDDLKFKILEKQGLFSEEFKQWRELRKDRLDKRIESGES